MQLGILALQGAVEPHRTKFSGLGVEAVPVRKPEELEGCDGLVLPGGESTTLLKLMDAYGFQAPLLDFASRRPVWGVCAGAILMAREVVNPAQKSLDLMPVRIRRNGYGRQNESFVAGLELRLPNGAPSLQEGVFIRAPQVETVGEGVEILAEHSGLPVVLGYNHHLLTTFHPELSPGARLHGYFLDLVRGRKQQERAG